MKKPDTKYCTCIKHIELSNLCRQKVDKQMSGVGGGEEQGLAGARESDGHTQSLYLCTSNTLELYN